MQGLNKFLNLVIVFGCVVIGYFFYQAKTENDKSNRSQQHAVDQSSVRPDMDPQDLANKYLQQAQQNMATDKLKAEINIKKAIADTQKVGTTPKVIETDPSKVSAEQQIWKDPANKPMDQRFSEQQINAPKNSGDLDKQEYIRQFKENARKNGYEISVNDELEVISVTPIRKPQNTKNDYDSTQNQGSSESEY
ncbi:hypothetical protein CIK05_01625 [Bdellovibrio sp. qaytius]|nr:hypothetical protein CIK05_01625 [Bdellovibrio sp. qaytius]